MDSIVKRKVLQSHIYIISIRGPFAAILAIPIWSLIKLIQLEKTLMTKKEKLCNLHSEFELC